MIEAGRQGVRVRCGGRAMPETGGFCAEPTILDDVAPEDRVFGQEIFGPVLAVTPVDHEAEAVRLANGTVYGLAAAVWTGDMHAAHRLSAAVAGRHGRGQCFDRSSPATPFGGFKQSGFGRDRSPHAVDRYRDLKTVWTAYR